MRRMIITNPQTGKKNAVCAWSVDPEKIRAGLKAGSIKTSKDVSWLILDDKATVAEMEETIDGEDANSNFALRVFETGLDWGLGIKVMWFLRVLAQAKKRPKAFLVAANRKGDCFIITHTGRVF